MNSGWGVFGAELVWMDSYAEEFMTPFRKFPHRRYMEQRAAPQIETERVYVRQEPDWALAWHHVDDWFSAVAMFRWCSSQRAEIL